MDEVAPGFRDSVLARQIIGPKQMQEGWDLIGGNIFHGELTVDQLFHMRPAVGYADYRTPIAGLYQASSATHAGGGVTGLPGHHCVREIVADRKARAVVACGPVGGTTTSLGRTAEAGKYGRRTYPETPSATRKQVSKRPRTSGG